MIEFLTANWLWIAVIVFFVAMHRGGHGCGMHGRYSGHQRGDQQHGGHAGHDHGAQARPAETADADGSVPERTDHGI